MGQLSPSCSGKVYDALIQKYASLDLGRSCSSVLSLSQMNGVQLSESSVQLLTEIFEDKNLKEEDDDFSSLSFIREEYKSYRESLTRRPWLKK
eukprot:gene7456-8722_t